MNAPKKQLGQHFLTAPSYAQRIANAVTSAPGEQVVEIGPGRGALSTFLLNRYPALHLIEVDADVIPVLQQKLNATTYTLHQASVLDFDFSTIGFPLHVVGNLPYNIGAMIIKKVLLYGSQIKSCTFMVQREVAERIVAQPHTKAMGFLSVFCQFFGCVQLLFRVPPGAFFPPPKIDSAVFQILVKGNVETARLPREHWVPFFKLIDCAFGMRRKILLNPVGRVHTKRVVEQAMVAVEIPLLSRAEDLSVEQWVLLYKQLYHVADGTSLS